MAVRWKAGQRRRRWTEQAVLLPRSAQERLEGCNGTPAVVKYVQQLQAFGQLPTTFAQIAATKPLADALVSVLQLGYCAEKSLHLFVELLFLDNSRPLHRGLLSTLSRLSQDQGKMVKKTFSECCLEYGAGGAKHRRFALVGVVASLANLPNPGILKGVTLHCLNVFALSACHDVGWVLQHAHQGGRPPPHTMEDCQDAMSSLYYMLQHFPDYFINPNLQAFRNEAQRCNSDNSTKQSTPLIGEAVPPNSEEADCLQWGNCPGRAVYRVVVTTLIDVLQTAALSRDCVVAAGVGLSAAAQFDTTFEGIALMLAKAAFSSSASDLALLSAERGLIDGLGMGGMLEAAISGSSTSSLAAEISKFTEFGRLCLLRGFLTAVPRAALNVALISRIPDICGENKDPEPGDDEGDMRTPPSKEWQVWTLLYNGILPALCALCEGSVDSHFKFHTVTALQICLQQVRASVTGQLTDTAVQGLADVALYHHIVVNSYDPMPASMISRILQIVWNNWEDPLTQTVKQVQIVFDLLVDVQSVFAQKRLSGIGDKEGLGNNEFVWPIAANLLAEGRYRKGKYVPLASLALRIGSLTLLKMSPNLLLETFYAQSDDDVCCSASTFLKSFLERLKEDCWSSEGGVMEGDLAFRRLWVPPLLSVLLSGNPRLRSNLNTYALPVALRIDADSLVPMLAFILDGADTRRDKALLTWDELEGAPGLPMQLTLHQRVAALISILKVARALALIDREIDQPLQMKDRTVNGDEKSTADCDNVVVWVKSKIVEVPIVWLEQSLTHLDDGLRVDAAELVCLSPKTASMPSSLELRMLYMSIPLNMRCSSTSFRMRWTSLLRKFFLRVRTAVWRRYRLQCAGSVEPQSVRMESSDIQGFREEVKQRKSSYVNGLKELKDRLPQDEKDDETASRTGATLAEMQTFMQWLSQLLLCSLYPSAPYERKSMAMEILNALIEVWSLSKLPERGASTEMQDAGGDFSPYHQGLLSVEATLVVVGAVVDSWDKLREGAFKILVRYPTPLPGLESTTAIESMLRWAKGLVNSPRVRESDAGALVLRLVFHKYVLDLGWTVKVHEVAASDGIGEEVGEVGPGRVGQAIADYLQSLNDWLEWGIEEGDRDLVKACEHSFVHGVLLALRYTMEELPWTSAAVRLAGIPLRAALHRLIALLLRVTALALWVVSADALNLPPDMASEAQSDSLYEIVDVNGDEEHYSEEGEGVAPVEQMIMVGCWLSMKEVSLLLGTIARGVPLPGCSVKDLVADTEISGDEEAAGGLLNTEQLEVMGEHFLEVLLAMKHNGAIDKTRAGFIALCDRLLRSHDPRLNKLPELWMQRLLNRTGSKGQTVDNLLRRSAGIPAAFLALFLAEPDGAPKKLLPMAMCWLIETSRTFVAQSTLPSQVEAAMQEGVEDENRGKREDDGGVETEGLNRENHQAIKERDEGVVPTVHAFNVMRVAFHDTNLATDTSGFCADGLITAIQAFSCPHWEVRNSATLAFAALVHRTIGFLNVYKRESARRAITGFEFFHRFPTLHPFLLQELRSATLQLEHMAGSIGYEGHGMANTLHPSLGPVLIILSRLKPSIISSGVGDWLSAAAFRPYVTSCATQRNLHVRVLASHALPPLVSSEDLPTALMELAQSLRGLEVLMGDDSLARAKTNNHTGPKGEVWSFNAVHGVLLQVSVLLRANCATLPDVDLRRSIVTKLLSVIESCLWLGSTRHCHCYMVIGAFFDMLEGMLEVAQGCHQVLRNQEGLIMSLQAHLLQLCSECLEDVTEDAESWHVSLEVNLRERAAKLYFGTAFTLWPLHSKAEDLAWNSSLRTVDIKKLEHCAAKSTAETETVGTEGNMGLDKLSCMIKRALSDRMYEVRLATLKVLKRFSGGLTRPISTGAGWDSSFLQPFLIERLSVEMHPGCIRHILQVFFAWRSLSCNQEFLSPHEGSLIYRPEAVNMVDGKDGWNTSSLDLWDRVLYIYRTSKQTKTKEVAMCCMGACLHQMLPGFRQLIEGDSLVCGNPKDNNLRNQSEFNSLNIGRSEIVASGGQGNVMVKEVMQWDNLKEAVNVWLMLVSEHSGASESVKFRRATAEAIVASGLLEEAPWVGQKVGQKPITGELTDLESESVKWYATAVLKVWCVSVKLLEDEDAELRHSLALCLLHVLSMSPESNADPHVSAAVPAQVERVVQLSFKHLDARFGQWRDYWDVLAQWILGTEDVASLMVRDADLVRRLFDKEIDNHHEEELFFVQLCCSHLRQLLVTDIDVAISQPCVGALPDMDARLQTKSHRVFGETWRRKFLEQSKLCAQLSVRLQEKMQWVGGVTNHQDGFKIVYRGLLGLWTLAGPCDCNNKHELIVGLMKVSELLQQLPLNPVVSNTLLRLLQLYEGHLDVDLGSASLGAAMGDAVCVYFKPLFLLK